MHALRQSRLAINSLDGTNYPFLNTILETGFVSFQTVKEYSEQPSIPPRNAGLDARQRAVRWHCRRRRVNSIERCPGALGHRLRQCPGLFVNPGERIADPPQSRAGRSKHTDAATLRIGQSVDDRAGGRANAVLHARRPRPRNSARWCAACAEPPTGWIRRRPLRAHERAFARRPAGAANISITPAATTSTMPWLFICGC